MLRFGKWKKRRASKRDSIVWCACDMRPVAPAKGSALVLAAPIYTLWLRWSPKRMKLIRAIGKYSIVNGLILTNIWSTRTSIKWTVCFCRLSLRTGQRASISRARITYTNCSSEIIKFIRSNLHNRCHDTASSDSRAQISKLIRISSLRLPLISPPPLFF